METHRETFRLQTNAEWRSNECSMLLLLLLTDGSPKAAHGFGSCLRSCGFAQPANQSSMDVDNGCCGFAQPATANDTLNC